MQTSGLLRVVQILIYFFAVLIGSTRGGQHQKRLLEALFKEYDPEERPVANDTDALNVLVGLAIQQIVDVDEKKQTLVFSGWLDMTWNDYNLVWDPAEFGNISTIRVTSSKIWTPDLLLYNSADDSFDVTSKVNAVVTYDGTVSYVPPGMFRSTCAIVIEDFPFDEQNCSLKFGSWTNDETTIVLKNKSDSAQLDSYIKNGEWFLMGAISYAESISYECCPTKYPFVMFVISMRRRTLYFIVNLIFPCVLISFMSVLGFSLPPDSGEKIGLEITTLLSIMMFSQIITGIIPESSLSVPKIALYFMSVMVISAMSIVANVAVLIFHHRNVKIQKPMPKWVEMLICGYLAKFLGMKSPRRRNAKKPQDKRQLLNSLGSTVEFVNTEQSSKSLLANVLDINDDWIGGNNKKLQQAQQAAMPSTTAGFLQSNGSVTNKRGAYLRRENSNLSQSGGTTDSSPFGSGNSNGHESSFYMSKNEMMRKCLSSILKELRSITQKLREEEDEEENGLEWKFAAMVIDRLCMIVFAVATLLSAILILFTSKNIFKPSDPSPTF